MACVTTTDKEAIPDALVTTEGVKTVPLSMPNVMLLLGIGLPGPTKVGGAPEPCWVSVADRLMMDPQAAVAGLVSVSLEFASVKYAVAISPEVCPVARNLRESPAQSHTIQEVVKPPFASAVTVHGT